MIKINPVIAYMVILSIIQPASVEEIEKNAAKFFGADWAARMIKYKALRDAHETAMNLKLIVEAENFKFNVTSKGSNFVNLARMKNAVDKKRIYFLKQQLAT